MPGVDASFPVFDAAGTQTHGGAVESGINKACQEITFTDYAFPSALRCACRRVVNGIPLLNGDDAREKIGRTSVLSEHSPIMQKIADRGPQSNTWL